MSKKSLDVESLCRTCMTNRAKISSASNALKCKRMLHEKPTGCWNDGLTIMELLHEVMPKVRVRMNDKLPKIMCYDCVEHLQSTFEFLKMCKDTDEKFRKMLKEDDTSDEEQMGLIDPVLGTIVDKLEFSETNVSASNRVPEFESMFIDNSLDADDGDNPFGNDSSDDDDTCYGTTMETRQAKNNTSEPGVSSSTKGMSDFGSASKKMKRVHCDNNEHTNSCCNCDAIEKNMEDIKVTVHQVQSQLKLAMASLAEQKGLLKKLLRQQCEEIPLQRRFPLTTVQELEDINSEISPENRNQYIKAMRPLLHPLPKNLQNVISDEVVAAYNIDGIHGKGSLRQLSNFYDCLLDAIPFREDGGNAEEQLRRAIRLQKKRFIKRNSVARSKNL